MRNQFSIYTKNGTGVRNRAINNVNMSSDYCIFVSPTYTLSGGTKIPCNDITCELSATTLSAATTAVTECLETQQVSGSCIDTVTWYTRILEDDVVAYSGSFFSATDTTSTPALNPMYTSLETGFNTLGYNYTRNGSEFTITRPFGVDELKLDVYLDPALTDVGCVQTGVTWQSGQNCYCLGDYELTVANDDCVFTATTAATFNGTGSTIAAGDTNANYGSFRAYFFETIDKTNQSLPYERDTSNNTYLEDQTGGTLTVIANSDVANTFWGTAAGTNGRLNAVGLSASTTEWLGFTECIDIVTGGTYYIGLGADNYARFSVDGELVVVLSGNNSTDRNFKAWNVFPYEFTSGKHIIEMQGLNQGSDSAFAAEIYNPVDFATLTGATSTGDTGLVFTTDGKVGDTWDVGTNIGYSCPSGYALDICGTATTCTQLDYTGLTCENVVQCLCPSGYTATTNFDSCQQISYSAVSSGTTYTATSGASQGRHGYHGLIILEDITNKTWPIGISGTSGNSLSISGTNFTVDGDSQPVAYQYGGPGTGSTYIGYEPQITNDLWGNSSSTTGRLNEVGIWTTASPNPTNEWIGFSKCIDLTSGGTYYVGIAADDRARFTIDGDVVYASNAYSGAGSLDPYVIDFRAFTRAHWTVFPIELSSGKHIVTIEGQNGSSFAALGGEIYSGTSAAALASMTSSTQLDPYIIFSTIDFTGQTFTVGESSGFSCPSGYTYDVCYTGTPRCVEINNASINCYSAFTADSCVTSGYTVCGGDFEQIDSGSTGVHIISTATTIPLEFNFTGNTEYLGTGTTVRYEVYKYSPTSHVFVGPALYKSAELQYAEISGTTAFSDSIPIADLSLDGDYLVKTYYNHNVCTDFGSRLGNVVDTKIYATGDKFSLYEEAFDYFFVATTSASTPSLVPNVITENNPTGALRQQVFIPSSGQTQFPVNGEFVGNISVTLNGITLAQNYDWSYSSNTVILTAETYSTDIVTLIYAGNNSQGLTNQVYDVSGPVVSGATDGEGTNTVYYNTGTSKYELFLDITPVSGNDVIVSINGATLTNNIDYYLSSSNQKRIILTGNIVVGDIIVARYVPSSSVANGTTEATPTITWTIPVAPQAVNGLFTIEVSSAETFTTITSSATTPYVVGQTSYGAPVEISGSFGDELYYRVKNQKDYVSMKGDEITSIAYSEIVPLTVQTNAINTY